MEKNYNISFIKWILAILVIFSHSFPISKGINSHDILYNFSNGQLDFGKLSVCIFLFFSGFFITKSLSKNSNIIDFFKKRVVKILPPLFIVLLITVLIIGPLTTTLSIKQYFIDLSWLKYLLKNMLLITTHTINGVLESNAYYQSINGSLWTLPVEFLCYIFCFIAYKLTICNKNKLKYTFPIFIIVYILFNYKFNNIYLINTLLPLVSFFYIGMLSFTYKDNIKLNKCLVIISIILLLVSLKLNFYSYISIIIIPYIVLYLSFASKQIKLFKNKIFTLSYEVYLVGFLVQQVVCYVFGGIMNPYINFIISIRIVIICSYVINKINQKLQLTSRCN